MMSGSVLMRDPGRMEKMKSPAAEEEDVWKNHIIKQLRSRDKHQHAKFQDLVRFYTRLLEKTSFTKGFLCTTKLAASDSLSSLVSQNAKLNKTTGELVMQVVEFQQLRKVRDKILEEQQVSLSVYQSCVSSLEHERGSLQAQVCEVQEDNQALKMTYDLLLERHRELDQAYRRQQDVGHDVLEELIASKQQAAARLNRHNQMRDVRLQRDLEKAASSHITLEISGSFSSMSCSSVSAPSSPSSEKPRLFRSSSAPPSRLLTSLKELFDRKRKVSSQEEENCCPIGFCLAARVPTRALHILDAHEQGINAVRFSSISNVLATGGTDCLIKLWDVHSGSLKHRATLDGNTEGITSIEFNHLGTKVIAGSYDKSALLWCLSDSVPKVCLTGHKRKVTSVRFRPGVHQVVTASADRTLKTWDLHRAACVHTVEVLSYCSDVVCSVNSLISGHYDGKIRMWDSRMCSCTQEVCVQGKVTSLDICPYQRQLLSCCRDDSLQLLDLRTNGMLSFRADGFKCGSDSTKAIFSPDGSYVAAGSADGAVYIWNVTSGNLEAHLPDKHSSSISSLSWSLSGEFVVSVDKSRRAVLWSDL